MTELTILNQITSHSFLASLPGRSPFVIRETTDGWKTEGNPDTDGLLCVTRAELVEQIMRAVQ